MFIVPQHAIVVKVRSLFMDFQLHEKRNLQNMFIIINFLRS